MFEDGGVFNLGNYGDFVLFGESVLARIIPDLSDFLRQYDYTLGNASIFFQIAMLFKNLNVRSVQNLKFKR